MSNSVQRLQLNMDHYEFWLQNQQILDPRKNLVEQCVQVGKISHFEMEEKRDELNLITDGKLRI